MSKTSDRQRVFFEVVLGKSFVDDYWTPMTLRAYQATTILYEQYGNGRTYEEFVRQMLGG